MQNSFMDRVPALLTAACLGISAAAFDWLAINYVGLTLATIPLVLLGSFYTVAAMTAAVAVAKPEFLRGSSLDVLQLSVQRWIRGAALLLPIPAITYCCAFALCIAGISNTSADVTPAVQKLIAFEMAVFGKSVAVQFVPQISRKADHDVDFGPYMAEMQRKIKGQWSPPKAGETRKVVVQFKLSAEGEPSHLQLIHSSGSEESDRKALAAVTEASPYAHLPSGAPDSVDIQFTFDYNVFSRH
jgi:TonB family protein